MVEGILLDVAQKAASLLYWQGVKDGACYATIACILLFLLISRGDK